MNKSIGVSILRIDYVEEVVYECWFTNTIVKRSLNLCLIESVSISYGMVYLEVILLKNRLDSVTNSRHIKNSIDCLIRFFESLEYILEEVRLINPRRLNRWRNKSRLYGYRLPLIRHIDRIP